MSAKNKHSCVSQQHQYRFTPTGLVSEGVECSTHKNPGVCVRGITGEHRLISGKVRCEENGDIILQSKKAAIAVLHGSDEYVIVSYSGNPKVVTQKSFDENYSQDFAERPHGQTHQELMANTRTVSATT